MNIIIATIDLLAASLFLAAAILALLVSNLTGARTRLWSYVTVVNLLFFLDRVMNSFEWALNDPRLAILDKTENYLVVVACLVLLYVCLHFVGLMRARSGPASR